MTLLNGRRQVYTPARLPGGRFVDINAFPAIALDRIEVLKEGASAIYGSDAVAGVANFVTRRDFQGFEMSASHDYFSGAGDTSIGAIWGTSLGEGTNAVLSADWARRQELKAEERDWVLRPYPGPGGGGWSYYGNPGAFLRPTLTGTETPGEFISALIRSHYGDSQGDARLFVDPGCEDLGGTHAGVTCRFRYQAWDNMIENQWHARFFGELNSELTENTSVHVEGLWSEAAIPDWYTTPSFPPISLYDGLQVVQPENPGRQTFCSSNAASAGFASQAECLDDDWFFYGRLVGNSGPGRTLSRASRTQRLAASLDHHIGTSGNLDVAVGYSRASGNVNQPAEYAYRKYLAFRGFGGPDCGVGVVVDPASAAGMGLGDTGGAVAGQGNCMFYNPFSSAIQRAQQPGTRYTDADNPNYVASSANSPALIDWINEEVDLFNTAELLTAEATLTNSLSDAIGYQFRWFDVSGQPNNAGNQSTFRVPSVDDVNTEKITALEYVWETDVYKAVDTYGSPDLVPERATTGNVGLVLFHFPSRTQATFDFWTYDFKDIINVIPYTAVTRLYDEGGASREAVKEFIKCPDGWGTGTCDAALIERIRIDLVNWPGMKTSGLDWSLSTRRPVGSAEMSFGLDGTYTHKYDIMALTRGGVELQPATSGAGLLNRNNPIAWPLPQWKWTASVGLHTERFTAVGTFYYISSYDDPDSADENHRVIGSFGTLDATFPPLVNWETSYDGFTHDPKGRRLKVGLTYTIS